MSSHTKSLAGESTNDEVYVFILYFRKIVLEATIPSVELHLLLLLYVVVAVGIGCWMYKKYNTRFLYYV